MKLRIMKHELRIKENRPDAFLRGVRPRKKDYFQIHPSLRLAARYLGKVMGKYRGFTQTPFFQNGFADVLGNGKQRLSTDFSTLKKKANGFTLIEVVVSTTIFAFVAVAMMALFNYTLKINRRAEAIRQATQGIMHFTEYIVKIVRNGDIDFGLKNGHSDINDPVSICPLPTLVGNNTYEAKENRLGLYNEEGERLCIYLGDRDGNAVTSGYVGETLILEKDGGFKQVLNPPNYKIENVMFLIRPLADPYVSGAVKTQPFVTIIMKVSAELPTGEIQPIFYQTTVSSDKYDIPN